MESFMVRVWTPGEADATSGLHGTALHLRSGHRVTFVDPAALITFLSDGSRETSGECAPEDARMEGDGCNRQQ
jgi:hypothetical protein